MPFSLTKVGFSIGLSSFSSVRSLIRIGLAELNMPDVRDLERSVSVYSFKIPLDVAPNRLYIDTQSKEQTQYAMSGCSSRSHHDKVCSILRTLKSVGPNHLGGFHIISFQKLIFNQSWLLKLIGLFPVDQDKFSISNENLKYIVPKINETVSFSTFLKSAERSLHLNMCSSMSE